MSDNTNTLAATLTSMGIEKVYELDVAQVPEPMLRMFFEYGVQRKRNDTVNSDVKKGRDEVTAKVAKWTESKDTDKGARPSFKSVHGKDEASFRKDAEVAWNTRLLAGEIGTGTRAGKLSYFERALREITLGQIRALAKKGIKTATHKESEGGEALVKTLFTYQLIAKYGEKGLAKLDKAIEANRPKLDKVVEKRAAELEKADKKDDESMDLLEDL